MNYYKQKSNKQALTKVFRAFTDAVGGDVEEFMDIVYAKYTVEHFVYADDWHYFCAKAFFEQSLIPHKIAVYQAGLEISRTEFFKSVMDTEKKEQFLWNLWLHDISKISESESFGYAFYNHQTGDGKYGFERAWHHHKMHNEHHPEYWLNVNRSGSIEPIEMPDIYIFEMIADWIGAGKTYGSTLEEWLPKNIGQFLWENNQRVAEILNAVTNLQFKAIDDYKITYIQPTTNP